jgi:hypothetical protein
VPGVAPGTLDEALSLVGRGWVASVVGRLRPDVRVVDVDLSGERGILASRSVADWCQDRGLWHLVRASGGGHGRQHIFIVPGVHLDPLRSYLEALRADLRASRVAIDLREHVRPLSAPHRRTGATAAPASAAAALTALREVLEPLPDRILDRRAVSASPLRRQGRLRAPATPMPRRRRRLPAVWASYLEQGRTAAAAVDIDPGQRSLIEAMATFQLVICGYSEPEAWQEITAAHPSAFPKARERGRQWWWTVWNAAVRDADTYRREHLPERHRDALPETKHARAVLEATWRSWPARTRHRNHEVASVLLDVMERVGEPVARIAQRELLLQCAMSSRNTVRAALADLKAAAMFVVHETYVPGTTETSHTITIGPALERSTHDADGGAVSDVDPHAVTHPRPSLGLRTSLGLPAAALLHHLPSPASPTGLPAAALAASAGLVTGITPTDRELRTARQLLRVLSELGLARVDASGEWRALSGSSAGRDTLDSVATGIARRKQETVQAERAEFKAALQDDQRRVRWAAQRARVLAATPKQTVLAERRQWWVTLDPAERAAREQLGRRMYTRLSTRDQAAFRERKARERSALGVDELTAYRQWEHGTPIETLEARSQEFALWFHSLDALAQAERLLHVRAHRERHGLPRHAPREPKKMQLPERELLVRQPPTTDELVLFDASLVGATPTRGAATRSAPGA